MTNPLRISFCLKNDLGEIETLVRHLNDFGLQHDLAPRIMFDANLVLEELVTNIIVYGFDDGREHQLQVNVIFGKVLLTMVVIDDGKEFNPLEAPPPELVTPAEDRDVGGLGIHLVKEVMDDIHYQRDGSRNILTLQKSYSDGVI